MLSKLLIERSNFIYSQYQLALTKPLNFDKIQVFSKKIKEIEIQIMEIKNSPNNKVVIPDIVIT
jgi:hypothetical protein